jgi:hypothetical protein
MYYGGSSDLLFTIAIILGIIIAVVYFFMPFKVWAIDDKLSKILKILEKK